MGYIVLIPNYDPIIFVLYYMIGFHLSNVLLFVFKLKSLCIAAAALNLLRTNLSIVPVEVYWI
jgi:hypothetical protein